MARGLTDAGRVHGDQLDFISSQPIRDNCLLGEICKAVQDGHDVSLDKLPSSDLLWCVSDEQCTHGLCDSSAFSHCAVAETDTARVRHGSVRAASMQARKSCAVQDIPACPGLRQMIGILEADRGLRRVCVMHYDVTHSVEPRSDRQKLGLGHNADVKDGPLHSADAAGRDHK